MNNDLNYLKLIQRLWKMRRAQLITSLQADLYYTLVEECNDRRWQNPFACKNDLLLAATGMSDSGLSSARKKIFDIGLIGYSPGIAKKAAPIYKLYESDSEFLADYPGHYIAVYPFKKGIEPNIIGNKQNQTETFAPIGASDAGAEKKSAQASGLPLQEQRSAPEKEKSCAQKEKDTEPAVPHWRAITSLWYAFNQQHLHIKPSFKGRDPKCLRDIMLLLQKRGMSAGMQWTESDAVNEFQEFLQNAWADEKFLQKKFLLKNLESQYDAIIAQQHNGAFAAMPARSGFQAATNLSTIRGRGGSFADIQRTQRAGSANGAQ